MPLFTDGPISCVEDLTAQDSQLLDVASVERIDTTKKVWLAQEQVAMDLTVALKRLASTTQPQTQAAQITLNMVVVTPPLKLWNTAHSLELFYADAYNSQLNDRYAGKRDQFHDLATWAFGKLMEIGVGVTVTPVPRARIPILTPFPGALPDGVYYVTMDWVDQPGTAGHRPRPPPSQPLPAPFWWNRRPRRRTQWDGRLCRISSETMISRTARYSQSDRRGSNRPS